MEIDEFKDVFEQYLNKTDLRINDEKINLFYTYMNELLEWNEKFNLTAITEPREVILKHFIDSLLIDKYIHGDSLIDIGTGAGFPGIPVKIYNDKLNITLLDSLNKRIGFLNNIIEKLNLKSVQAIHGRAEDYGKDINYRERFDIVTSRAVADLKILSEYMLPFVCVGGTCICMKGQNSQEIDDAKDMIKILGGKIVAVDEYVLPMSEMNRTVIIIKKERNTPTNYPRRPNQIKK